MEEKRYTAFISYRHVEPDRTIAVRLHSLIENYHIPKTVQSVTGRKSIGRVFRDEEELPLSVSLSDNIEYALSESEWLIVVCSPALMESKWCMQEIDTFIRQGKKDHILLVLASGTPEASFPPQMRTAFVNGVEIPVEPLAANVTAPTLKESLKKLNTEKLRAIASILGVNFDDLRRRARGRKLRITAAAAAGVLALSVFSGVLISRAWQDRKMAAEQTARAETERQNAKAQEAYAAQKADEARREQIGKNIEAINTSLGEGERLAAVVLGMETLELSDCAKGERRDEILELIRRACYGQTFSPLASMDNRNLALHYITASPDGRYLLGIANTNTVTLIDTFSGETAFQFARSSKQAIDPFFSPDGSRFLANCDEGRSIFVWNTEDRSLVCEIPCDSGEYDELISADFIGDSDHVLVHDHDKIYVYDLTDDSRELLYTLGSIDTGFVPEDGLFYYLTGENPSITFIVDYAVPVAASRDGSRILIGGADGMDGVIIIDRSGNYLCTLQGLPGLVGDRVTFSPDGSMVAYAASFLKYFGVWDTSTGDVLWLDIASDNLSSIVFSPDSRLACFTMDEYLLAVDARSGETVFCDEIDGEDVLGISLTPGVEFSPDSKDILLSNMSFFVIDAASGTPIARFTEPHCHFAYTTFSDNGKYLVVAEQGGTVSLMSTEYTSTIRNAVGSTVTYISPAPYTYASSSVTLQSAHELNEAFKSYTPESEQTAYLLSSPDGRYEVLLHADGAIELFEPAVSPMPLYFLFEFQNRAVAAAFGGHFFAASDRDGRVLLFDLDTGEIVQNYAEDIAAVDLCFSEDGTILLAADYSGLTVSVYPTDGGKKLFTMTSSYSVITGMGFTEDGKSAVAVYDGGAIIADLLNSEDELLAFASMLAADIGK